MTISPFNLRRLGEKGIKTSFALVGYYAIPDTVCKRGRRREKIPGFHGQAVFILNLGTRFKFGTLFP